MEFFKKAWAKIVIGLSIALGIVLYLLKIKNEEIVAYKSQIKLADTKEKVNAIEQKILSKMKERADNAKEVEKLKNHLTLLDKRKEEIAKAENRDVEEYWSNN